MVMAWNIIEPFSVIKNAYGKKPVNKITERLYNLRISDFLDNEDSERRFVPC